MLDVDWAVWPIFILQVVALILMLLPAQCRICGVSIRSIVMTILIVICIAIAASLYHDATDVLKLYF